jgi:hypothetical protein
MMANETMQTNDRYDLPQQRLGLTAEINFTISGLLGLMALRSRSCDELNGFRRGLKYDRSTRVISALEALQWRECSRWAESQPRPLS